VQPLTSDCAERSGGPLAEPTKSNIPVHVSEAHEPPETRVGFGRRIAWTLVWPLRRFFDPRLNWLAHEIEVSRSHLSREILAQAAQSEQMRTELAATRTLVGAVLDATAEAATITGQGMTEIRSIAEDATAALARIEGRVTPEMARQLSQDGRVDEVDAATSRLLNYASSHRGFAAQRNLWFNWPVSVAHEPGDARIGRVNERVAEFPYAFRALSGVAPGAKILDVGASESTLSLSLASLGYDVTAIDPRPYPLQHPRLRIVVSSIEEWESDETFAAVLCVSTLEHIGSGEYGQARAPSADVAALRRLHALTERNGLLVLTTPYGDAHPTNDARIYDRATLESLLADWLIEDFTVIAREDPVTWSPTTRRDPVGEAVALVTARRRA
jgi:2-polyprenyl-3-methyl-5-hydroxy-6-metoxy-1,4-benzoquinol methylase